MKTWLHRFVLVAILVCAANPAHALTCLAAVAGGNWNTAGTWTNCGGGVPSSADDADLTAVTGTLTIDGTSGTPSIAKNVTTGAAGTLSHGSAKQLDVYGSLTLTAGVTYSPNSASILNFKSTTTGNTITTAAKGMGPVTFVGVGGEWTLQDAYAGSSAANLITVTSGHLITNNQTVAGTLNASGTLTRAITLGTTVWTAGITNSSTPWTITDPTNLTFSGASSTIILPQTSAGAAVFASGGLTYGTVQATVLTSGTLTFSGSPTMTTWTIGNGSNVGSNFVLSGNLTASGTCTLTGNSAVNRPILRSSVKGTARTLSCGTNTFSSFDFQDITKAGAGTADISGITNGSGNCGGNTGWTFTTPATSYWVSSGGTSTGSMSAATRWATSSGGTAGTGRAPLCQDTSRFDASSIDAGSRTVTNDKPRIGAVNWTGVTNTPAFSKSVAFSFFGDLTMVSGMTNSGTSNMTYEGRSTSTITSGTQVLTNPLYIDAVASVGQLNLGDDLSMSTNNGTVLTVTSGTFYTNGFKAILTGDSAYPSYTTLGTFSIKAGTTGLEYDAGGIIAAAAGSGGGSSTFGN